MLLLVGFKMVPKVGIGIGIGVGQGTGLDLEEEKFRTTPKSDG